MLIMQATSSAGADRLRQMHRPLADHRPAAGLVSPALGLLMNMEPAAILATDATLLAGTPAITFIGATGAALAVALPRGGLLVSVLVLPSVIPVLIFGVMARLWSGQTRRPSLASPSC
jgi:heme exporter protein B